MKRTLAIFSLSVFLSGAPAVFAQTGKSDQGAKEDIKEAGRATGRATKKTARKVKKGTKKGVHKGAEKTEQGVDKVRQKTE